MSNTYVGTNLRVRARTHTRTHTQTHKHILSLTHTHTRAFVCAFCPTEPFVSAHLRGWSSNNPYNSTISKKNVYTKKISKIISTVDLMNRN